MDYSVIRSNASSFFTFGPNIKMKKYCVSCGSANHRTRKWKQIFVTQYKVDATIPAWNLTSRRLLSLTQFYLIFVFKIISRPLILKLNKFENDRNTCVGSLQMYGNYILLPFVTRASHESVLFMVCYLIFVCPPFYLSAKSEHETETFLLFIFLLHRLRILENSKSHYVIVML